MSSWSNVLTPFSHNCYEGFGDTLQAQTENVGLTFCTVIYFTFHLGKTKLSQIFKKILLAKQEYLTMEPKKEKGNT